MAAPENSADKRVCLGVIVAVHGVRGLVKVKPFTETPEALTAYGPLGDAAGVRSWQATLKGLQKGNALLALSGVETREAAEALKGLELYVPRDSLPEPAEEEVFYHDDLLGLAVEDGDGQVLGQVLSVQNFGAGDLLEVGEPGARSRFIPFTQAVVPTVDIASGRLVVDLPEET